MQDILKRLEDKIDTMDQRFEKMDQRFEKIDQRFEKIDQRFEKIDQRFEKMDQRFEKMDQRFEKMDHRFEKMDQRFDGMDQRFSRVEAELHKHGVLLESLDSSLKQTMETVAVNRQVMDDKFAEVLRKLDERVQPVELASRHFARQLAATSGPKRTRRKPRP